MKAKNDRLKIKSISDADPSIKDFFHENRVDATLDTKIAQNIQSYLLHLNKGKKKSKK